MQFLAALDRIEAAGEAVYGGKAAGLAALIRHNARVPAGFVLAASSESPEHWSEEQTRLVAERGAELLRVGPVAVRSSGLGEDSAQKSFAGQFETTLNVTSVDGLFVAIGSCIASGASDRVLAYAESEKAIPVGVVVQSMVDARAAGVCFTINPTGEDEAIIVEAVAGSGDALVSGRAQPQSWRVYRTGLGSFEAAAEPTAQAVLTEQEAEHIATGAADLAKAFAQPLDLEWAIDRAGQLWWLQARPITAAVPYVPWRIDRSAEGVDDGPVTVWSNWNVRETMPDPYQPLTWTTWREVIIPMIVEQVCGVHPSSPAFRHLFGLDLVNGYVYFNLNGALAMPFAGTLLAKMMSTMDARAGQTVNDLIARGVLRPRRLPLSRWRLFGSLTVAALRGIPSWMVALRPARAFRLLQTQAKKVAGRSPVPTLGDRELIEEMKLFAAPECGSLRDGLQMEAVAGLLYILGGRVFRHCPDARDRLGVGIEGNPTTAINIGIDALAAAAAPLRAAFVSDLDTRQLLIMLSRSEEGTRWLSSLDRFLRDFGHRGPKEFDLAAVRWSENPSMIVELVRVRLRNPPAESTTERLKRLGSERRRAVDEAIRRSPFWKRQLMRWIAGAVARHMPLREAPKHYGLFVFQRMRAAALELGRRMAERGVIEGAGDVFYAEWKEVVAFAEGGPVHDLRTKVAERREQFERACRLRPPDFVRSDGVPVIEWGEKHEEGELRGTPVSPGQGGGVARLLTAPDPNAFQEGDVLVMEYADPGWTPLFPRASAVVMEVGGAMCHAAVVARELGIPAVFGVRGAMKILHDGQHVTVDGRAGTVTVHPAA